MVVYFTSCQEFFRHWDTPQAVCKVLQIFRPMLSAYDRSNDGSLTSKRLLRSHIRFSLLNSERFGVYVLGLTRRRNGRDSNSRPPNVGIMDTVASLQWDSGLHGGRQGSIETGNMKTFTVSLTNINDVTDHCMSHVNAYIQIYRLIY